MPDSYLNNFRRPHRRQPLRQVAGDLQVRTYQRAKRAAMALHPGAVIIDLGVGEPDEMAFPEVVELCTRRRESPRTALPDQWRRGPENSRPARYPRPRVRRQGINPETEVLHSIGSNPPLLTAAPGALINPGDTC